MNAELHWVREPPGEYDEYAPTEPDAPKKPSRRNYALTDDSNAL